MQDQDDYTWKIDDVQSHKSYGIMEDEEALDIDNILTSKEAP